VRPSGDEQETTLKRTLIFLVAALALPTSVALAKGNPNKGGRSAPKVQYVLKGTLSDYTAGSSITIDVKHSNYHGRALRNQSLTFSLTAHSRVTFRHGSSLDGGKTAKGVIKIRAPRRVSGDLASQLPGLATRIHVVVLKNLS
jgi:hypothetical protein